MLEDAKSYEQRVVEKECETGSFRDIYMYTRDLY